MDMVTADVDSRKLATDGLVLGSCCTTHCMTGQGHTKELKTIGHVDRTNIIYQGSHTKDKALHWGSKYRCLT
jgi:hypothetical protein